MSVVHLSAHHVPHVSPRVQEVLVVLLVLAALLATAVAVLLGVERLTDSGVITLAPAAPGAPAGQVV